MKPLTWPSATSFAQMIVMSENVALPIQRFWPFSTHWSPSRRAVVRRPFAESEPESGSVSPNAPITSPRGDLRDPLLALRLRARDRERPADEAVLDADERAHRRIDPGELERDEPAEHRGVLERPRLVPGERQRAEVGQRLHDLMRELGPLPVPADDRFDVAFAPFADRGDRLLLAFGEQGGLVRVEIARQGREVHDGSNEGGMSRA